MDSEILAQALQRIIDSRKWEALIKLIDSYVDDPQKVVGDRMLKSVQTLIGFGRDEPEAWSRLRELVYRVKRLEVDSDILVKYRENDINDALKKLFANERPQRTIDSILELARSSEARNLHNRQFKKTDGLRILRQIACNDLPFFLQLVNRYTLLQDAKRRDYFKQTHAVIQQRRKQIAATLELVFHCTREPTRKEIDEAYNQLRRDRDAFVRSAVKAGLNTRAAITSYWEKVDAELVSTEKLLSAHKGGAKVNMNMVTLPRVKFNKAETATM